MRIDLKETAALLEKLYSENECAKYCGALSNVYLAIGNLHSLYTESKDYLWRAISYYDQASALIATTGDNSAFFEQLAKTYYATATVYQERDGHDDNIQKTYEYYQKAILYYEKLLWRSAPENIWISVAQCYNELAVLLLLVVKRIVEEKNKVVKALQNRPFDPAREQDYIRESADCFRKAIQYYEKLADLGYDNLNLPGKTATALYMLAGVTAMMPDGQEISNEDYLARGREKLCNLKASFTDEELFGLYYEIYEAFESVTVKYPEVRTVTDDCLAYFNEVLEKMRNDPKVDKHAVQLLEILVFGYSKGRRKVFWKTLFKLLLIASFESIISLFSPKKKKLKSKVRNNVDKTIKKKARNNVLSQQDKASSSLIFGVPSIVGSCVVLPCKYLLRLMTPFLLKISGNSQSVIQVFLWYDRFAIFASLLLLGAGLYACISAFRSKRAALKIAIIGLICSIVSSVVLLCSLNDGNYFQKQYNNAVALMDSGKYEEAIEVFESLYDYEDSLIKIEECNTAILEKKYDYAIGIMNKDNIIEAYEQLIELNGYKDSAEIAKSIYNTYKNELLQSAQIGDCVYFGVYEQDNDEKNGKEKIEWIVLDKFDNKLFVISKYILDCQVYNATSEDVIWETSTLRYWINSDFINTAFSDDEIAMIATTMVMADDNPRHDTNQGVSIQDKLFMLSIEEAKQYFDSNDMRKCQATNYAKSSGATNAGCAWWLRTIGKYQNYASHIWQIGGINDSGSCVNESDIGVRPAMWIELPR